jgi:hypothetical protein
MRFIVGIALGFVCGYLYGSERAREEAGRQWANAPEPVRRATEAVSGAIASVPVSDTVKQTADSVKQTASRASASIASAAQQATQSNSSDSQPADAPN